MSWSKYLNYDLGDQYQEDLLSLYWELHDAKENGADLDDISDIEFEVSVIESRLDDLYGSMDVVHRVQDTFAAAKALAAPESEVL